MLRWRIVLGVLFVAALAGLLWVDYRALFVIPPIYLLALLLSVIASEEVLGLLSFGGLRPIPWMIYLGNLGIVASNGVPLYWLHDCPLGRLGWPLAALGLSLVLLFTGEMHRYEKPGGVIANLAAGVFALVYVGVLVSFLLQLRMVGNAQVGMIALISLVVVVKMCDTGAYTVGRLCGRHKMTPTLSPGKTVEGAVGGLVFASIGSAVVFYGLMPWMLGDLAPAVSWWMIVAYAVLVGVAGIVGDLAESLLKRDMGRKDSSSWMPGFGGVLDMIDSSLLAAPVAYLCWLAGL